MRSRRRISLHFLIVEIWAIHSSGSTSTLNEACIFESIAKLGRIGVLYPLSYLIKGTYIYFRPFNNNYMTFLLHLKFFFLFNSSDQWWELVLRLHHFSRLLLIY